MKRPILIGVITLLVSISSLQSVRAEDTRLIDIVRITWLGAQESTPSTADIERSIQEVVTPNWRAFTSLEGDSNNKSINFSHGLTLASPIRLTSPMACERNDFVSFMNSIRDEAYRQLGLSNWQDRYLVILSPPNGCIWSGRAAIGVPGAKGGVMVLHNTSSGFVITHELGHSLGLGHSNLLRCENGARDGAWGRSCKAVEYGGTVDVMGNVDTKSPLSTYHQWRMGLLNSEEVRQSWLNESIELTASDIKGGVRAIFIRDGNSTYWIEYRRARTGVSINPGIVVYRTDPPSPAFIDSPNPEDRVGFDPGRGVSTDVWMLNLDNYLYSSTGRASGSMTLTTNKSMTFYSGSVTVEVLPANSDRNVNVKISRKPDTTPPPIPNLTPVASWRFPGIAVIDSLYDDLESAVQGFEGQIDGKIFPIQRSVNNSLVPTYLDPFASRPTVYVRDLPEGSYSLSLRATDVWGNKSPWSTATRVTVDRGVPVVGNEISIVGATESSLRVELNSIKDSGSGLCSTKLSNEDGFVLHSSDKPSTPEFSFPKNLNLRSVMQTFDCLGNGVIADFSLNSGYLPANKSSRTGKWISATSSHGQGALTCISKCSASFTQSGRTHVLVAEGQANVLVSGKTVAKVSASSSRSLRTGAIVDIGASKRVLRVSGSGFTLIGVAALNLEISNQREVARTPIPVDGSLADPIQKELANYGFNENDFANDWAVLPMARGTTLEDPTLDLCSATYKSEAGRQFRRQVVATKRGSPYLFLSSEVVKYKDSKAAEAALVELKTNYEACIKNKGGIERDGSFVQYSFYSFPKTQVSLVEEGSRVLVRAQIGSESSARQLLAFYQFRGEMFTGLYIVTAGEKKFEDKEVERWYNAASILAQRLSISFKQ